MKGLPWKDPIPTEKWLRDELNLLKSSFFHILPICSTFRPMNWWRSGNPGSEDVEVLGSAVVGAVQQRCHAATLSHPAQKWMNRCHSNKLCRPHLTLLCCTSLLHGSSARLTARKSSLGMFQMDPRWCSRRYPSATDTKYLVLFGPWSYRLYLFCPCTSNWQPRDSSENAT